MLGVVASLFWLELAIHYRLHTIYFTLYTTYYSFFGYLDAAVATVVDDAPARRSTASRPWAGSRCAGAVGWAPLGLAACLGSSSLILYNIVRYSII